jgi:hypothetical protein
MLFTQFIEQYLKRLGYSNITWHWGREGWYILTMKHNTINCINIKDLVENQLCLELKEREE